MNTWTLMSTISTMSTQGMMKNTPGPLAPPDSRSPSRNITALSYSCSVTTSRLKERIERIKERIESLHLHHLDHKDEGEGHGDEDEEDGANHHQVGAHALALFARWE